MGAAVAAKRKKFSRDSLQRQLTDAAAVAAKRKKFSRDSLQRQLTDGSGSSSIKGKNSL